MGFDEPMDCYESITEAPGLWHAKQAYLKVTKVYNFVYDH